MSERDDLLAEIEAVSGRLAAASPKSAQEARAIEKDLLSALAVIKKKLASLLPEERRHVGAALGEAQRKVIETVAELRGELEREEEARRLASEWVDLTEIVADPWPVGRLHLVTTTRDELEDVFVSLGFSVAEGPEAETDFYSFEALNIPRDHPARSMFDTLFLDVGGEELADPSQSPFLMRPHTSPVQIHLMEEQGPPIYAVMPGRTYRRETPDARHLATFHQIEGLVVDRTVTFGDLAGTIEVFTTAYFGTGVHSRLRPSYFPFTEPSAEFEITCTICSGKGCRTCSQTGWIELGGCGMVDPAVFAAVGIDPEEWSGFAFGFGIDRCAQMRHSIPDMRLLIANDVRFARQL